MINEIGLIFSDKITYYLNLFSRMTERIER
jgi:hypothetical protein